MNHSSASVMRMFQAPSRRADIFDNLSLFTRDAWRPACRISVTYGIRLEFVPPPRAAAAEWRLRDLLRSWPDSGSGSDPQRHSAANLLPRLGGRGGERDLVEGGFGQRAVLDARR
jgi:hypothetical protein